MTDFTITAKKADGSYLGTYQGFPYNFHETAAPETWHLVAEWIAANGGEPPDEEPLPPPPPPTQADFARAISAHIEATVQARDYDSGISLATYVNSSIASWAAEAQAFLAWRDNVWTYAYNQMGLVMAGERAMPTVEQIVSELPAMVWP